MELPCAEHMGFEKVQEVVDARNFGFGFTEAQGDTGAARIEPGRYSGGC
jgi:hypothetical protein